VPFHIYIYQTQIELTQEQAGQLDMGEEIEALAASVRLELPGQPGLVSAVEMHSFDEDAPVRVIFQSIWESWADLQRHLGSGLNAQTMLEEWGEGYLTKPPESQVFRQIGV
jgi:hypothetical protein